MCFTDLKRIRLQLSLIPLVVLLALAMMPSGCRAGASSAEPQSGSADATPAPDEDGKAGIVKGAARTIGDLLILSIGVDKVLTRVGDEAVKVVGSAGEEARTTLDQFQAANQELVLLLSEEYKGNLAVTIDSLDTGSQAILRNVEATLNEVNLLLQDDILLTKESSIEVVQAASQELQTNIVTLEESLGRTVVLAGETTAYVVDYTTDNIIVVVSIIMLGLGLLLFIYLFFTHRLPEGVTRIVVIAFMVVYLVAFVVLLFSPQTRAFLINALTAPPS